MSEANEVRGLHAPEGIAAARRAFVGWVNASGRAGRFFLEIRVRASGPGRYEVRHRADINRPVTSMQTNSSDPYTARVVAQATAYGAYRPLKTSPNLRRGWVLAGLDAAGLCIALDYLYPACVAHWHAGRTGTLRVTDWPDTAARQSGIYSAVSLLAEAATHRAVEACCGDAVCLRQVAWRVEGEDSCRAAATQEAAVPCPEACSMFISFARKLVTLERTPRVETPGLGLLNHAETEQIRAIAAAAATQQAGSVREGEFDEPLNLRRVRYLALRLAEAEAGT